jgi:hypothetical protein
VTHKEFQEIHTDCIGVTKEVEGITNISSRVRGDRDHPHWLPRSRDIVDGSWPLANEAYLRNDEDLHISVFRLCSGDKLGSRCG